jgi:post-segregation antitoxin (ccd killing protein)
LSVKKEKTVEAALPEDVTVPVEALELARVEALQVAGPVAEIQWAVLEDVREAEPPEDDLEAAAERTQFARNK